MQEETKGPPLAETEERIRALLGGILDRRRLFDALNALALLDAARCETSLTELALAWRREGGGMQKAECTMNAGGGAEAKGAGTRTTVRAFFERYAARCSEEQTASRANARSLGNVVARETGPDLPMEALRGEDLEAVLARYRSARSYNGMLDRLRAALRWGEREGLCGAEAARAAERIERRSEAWREPAFFLPDRVERIFRTAEAHPGRAAGNVGVVLTLGFFAGVRTAEIRRAAWEDLDLEGGVLRIPRPKGWTSGARPRLVELERNAAAWLAHWRRWLAGQRRGRAPHGPMVPKPWLFAEWKKAWLAPAGDSWGRDENANIMRHSYATHHVGAFRDAAATALNMGHGRGIAMLEEHYRGLVARRTAERYWRIFPS